MNCANQASSDLSIRVDMGSDETELSRATDRFLIKPFRLLKAIKSVEHALIRQSRLWAALWIDFSDSRECSDQTTQIRDGIYQTFQTVSSTARFCDRVAFYPRVQP